MKLEKQIDSALRDMISGRAKQFKTIDDIKNTLLKMDFAKKKNPMKHRRK